MSRKRRKECVPFQSPEGLGSKSFTNFSQLTHSFQFFQIECYEPMPIEIFICSSSYIARC